MARGLKIAHKQTDGTLVDQRLTGSATVSSQYFGGVGGIPAWVTGGVRTLKVQYRDSNNVYHGNAYIIAQKGSSQFLVANAVGAVNGATHSNASVTVCTLVNTADPANVAANTSALSSAATMCITGYTTANAAFAAKRITSKHVYDFSSNKYRYRHAATQVATATFANVVVH
jgi:hypothetical protein